MFYLRKAKEKNDIVATTYTAALQDNKTHF